MKSLTRGYVKTGLDSMQRAKLRNFWTMLGVIIGVASVIIIVSIGEGVKQQISGQAHQAGSDLIAVRPAALQTNNGIAGTNINALSEAAVTGSLSQADATTVSKLNQVGSSSPLAAVPGDISGDNGAYRQGIVIGTSSDLPGLLHQGLAYGSYFDDNNSTNQVVVLGSLAAQKLFNEQVPLGHSLAIHGQQFIVVGIFNQFDTTPFSQDADFNNAIFIPTQQAELLTNNSASIYEILAKPKQSSQTNVAITTIKSKLDNLHGGSGGITVALESQDQMGNTAILNLLTTLVAGVAAISLLVGGIGIMNVMSVSVAERLHEIGVRKAIGATNRQILGQFVVEATAISLSGGIIGIIIASIVDVAFRLATDIRPALNWQIIALATVVSLFVGIVFGSFPALKAARKDPIEALRAE